MHTVGSYPGHSAGIRGVLDSELADDVSADAEPPATDRQVRCRRQRGRHQLLRFAGEAEPADVAVQTRARPVPRRAHEARRSAGAHAAARRPARLSRVTRDRLHVARRRACRQVRGGLCRHSDASAAPAQASLPAPVLERWRHFWGAPY